MLDVANKRELKHRHHIHDRIAEQENDQPALVREFRNLTEVDIQLCE
jgi:hypothetical protein